jgi:hypothetical protein
MKVMSLFRIHTQIHGDVIMTLYRHLKQTKLLSFFPKTGDRKVKTGPVWELIPVGGKRI